MGNVEFTNKIEIKNFAFDSNVGLGEEVVKASVADFLRGQGSRVRHCLVLRGALHQNTLTIDR